MIRNYLKLAVKVLMRRKFFTAVSLFGVSFTLVVLLIAMAMIDQEFVPQGVEKNLDRTYTVRGVRLVGKDWVMQTPAGYKFLDRYVKRLETPELVSAFGKHAKVASYQGGIKRELNLKRTDGEYWRILDFEFLEGAPFTPADEREARFVAVVNESTRRHFFGSTPALGKPIEVDGQRFRVTGVVRDVSWLQTAAFADVWVPISTARSDAYRESLTGEFIGLVMARSKSDLPRVREEFDAMLRRVEVPKGFDTFESHAETRFEGLARVIPPGNITTLRLIFLAAALLFMSLPAINLINMNLSRIMERSSEIGVRKAFGASTRELVGQFVVENVVLTVIGGLIGLAAAAGVLAALNRTDYIPYAQLGVNIRIFGYAMLMAVAFGLLSGVYPAWRMSRLHPVQALRGGTR